MSDRSTQLEREIAALTQAIASLAGIPDVQAPLLEQLSIKRRELETLTGGIGGEASANQTTIHGDVTGPVLSGTFSGAVNVGPTTVSQGPQISGSIQANRDVNVTTHQTIHNVETAGGDNIQVGDISGSTGVAIGRGAKSVVRTVDTGGGDYAEGNIDKRQGAFIEGGTVYGPVVGVNSGTIAGDYQFESNRTSASIVSTLRQCRQTVDAAAHLDPALRGELNDLIAQLLQALQQLPALYTDEAEAVAEAARQLVDTATRPRVNAQIVLICAAGFRQAAGNASTVMPVVGALATKVLEKIRGITPA